MDKTKYVVSYINDDVPQAIIVESTQNKEAVKRFFMSHKPSATIYGVEIARSCDMKPGIPVLSPKEMTHAEYIDYMTSLAEKVHTDKNYSIKDYKKDLSNILVKGFDLSKYDLTPSQQLTINNWFGNEIKPNEFGNKSLTGFTMNISRLADILGCEYEFDNSYNGYYVNPKNHLILSYSEGDMTLWLCETEEAYNKQRVSLENFYNKQSITALIKEKPRSSLEQFADKHKADKSSSDKER